MKQYINHSGGSPGADMSWERHGQKYGIRTIAYSFHNHKQHSPNQKILNVNELDYGWKQIQIAEKTLNRKLENVVYPYIKNLMARNWFQVCNSHVVYAVGEFDSPHQNMIKGGTGWSVQMAIDNNKPIYLFEQLLNTWFVYDYDNHIFVNNNEIPILSENFAGIGASKLNKNGELAIIECLEKNFEPMKNEKTE